MLKIIRIKILLIYYGTPYEVQKVKRWLKLCVKKIFINKFVTFLHCNYANPNFEFVLTKHSTGVEQ